jgi:TonB family protein
MREIQGSPRSSGPIPIENYFSLDEVDVRAEPTNEVLLRYPWMEYKRRLRGVVSFRLYISAQGTLDKVELIEGVPPGHFEEAALEAVRQLQFSPARKNGRPVKSQKTIDVVFDPDESLDRVSATQPDPSAAGR